MTTSIADAVSRFQCSPAFKALDYTRVGASIRCIAARKQCAVFHAKRSFIRNSRAVTCAVQENKTPFDIEQSADDRMEKSVDSIRNNLNTVRTGRANAAILDRIEVEYYGSVTPLKSLANITTPDAQTIIIQPFDKNIIDDVEKAIMSSDLDLMPGNDGNCIRLNIPPLTAERRRDLAKLVSKLGEDGKVALRNVRRDTLRSIGKLKGYSEDEIKSLENNVEKMTLKHTTDVDEVVRKKEDEISKV
ncbi:ribosomal recycling factor, chloroplast precursor [Micromonas pusilla CCMP1545]|uniref:Ribosome-recycling factor, chloroplastic n=1 Tax=Micromonas pusilla (strain CCMP1545) TaxID=564608 RepID=C1MKX0_MICPC|nr:ribosomal recycling factor, chloroplast precursor [Micromonas pusilla CCMP1545]EEH59446.1 ribosomal recycling factor, chloroplast precursor [Micromonas pusilla CCMP1545]|mmetsp:Transcript_114319/g.277583  ORF Transcript_114319/g.277583 Transcript_114319/m.277583 type:complete len:246 (-) Transcript_114319:717-1454(-)|eukprot:XP_003056070.1 ribosomal recycling factor, chloroplast precursor [Micromonas pusilla CCMP1545]